MNASASILLNGSPSPPFKLHRGLRQGDPLSPFLFDLVVEILSLVFQKAISMNLWEGIDVGSKEGLKISHLQYADDTILFCPPKIEYLLNIKKVLILFQLASGLQVNFHKSSIMGIHVDDSWLNFAADCLLCKTGTIPFIYLGLPIGGSSSRLNLWDPIIARMEKKLALWKGRLLSLAGHLTLIKAALSSLPIYFMSIFPIPKGVIEKINKIQQAFLWCGSADKSPRALISWKIIELPKLLGGLSVGNLLHRNLALLFKWVWRYFCEPKALWRTVIREKYGYSDTFTIHDLFTLSKGGPWKNICNSILNSSDLHNILFSKIKMRVGNGASTLFWHEIWLCNLPLKVMFPRLYRLASNPMAMVASLGLWNGWHWTWLFSWSRSLRPRDSEEYESLKALLDSANLAIDGEDSLVWTPHKSGIFFVKSLCLELAKASNHGEATLIKGLWRGLIPPRIELFSWLALQGKINTKSKLVRIGIISSDDILCVMCNESPEDHNHLLLHCPFAWRLWSWWLMLWNVCWVPPKSLLEAFEQWHSCSKGAFLKKIWIASFHIVIWTIWKERNARIFRDVSLTLGQLQELILVRLSWRIKGWDVSFPYSTDDIIRNPTCLAWSPPNGLIGQSPHSSSLAIWSPPPLGHLKWIVDASYCSNLRMSAIGGVLRGNDELFKCMFSCPTPPIEINSAEVLAIFRAIQISTRSANLKSAPLVIESDSRNAVKWCNDDQGGPWNLCFQINFIRNGRRKWLSISIIHKGRESNMVADSLAKQGLHRDADFIASM